MIFLPRTDLQAQERCRDDRGNGDPAFPATRIYGWRQVPVNVDVIGEKANATRPEIEQIMVEQRARRRRQPVRGRPLHHPPADREGGAGRKHHGLLHLLAVLPVGHLQGHVPGRAADRLLSRPAGRAVRFQFRDLSTSAIRPTPSRPGVSRSRSGCSRITARSTRCRATSTGCAATRRVSADRLRRPHRRHQAGDPAGSSDSAALDAVFELLVRPARELPDGQDDADPRGVGRVARPCLARIATSTLTATR